MADLKTLVICSSVHHGNTRRIAEAMAEVLGAEVLPPEEVAPERLDEYDLLGWGSGIYFSRHADGLCKLASQLTQRPRKAFVFSTAGLPLFRFWFHGSLRRTLKGRGCTIVGEFSCGGWDTVGPLAWFGGIDRNHPNEADLQRARTFAKSLLGRV